MKKHLNSKILLVIGLIILLLLLLGTFFKPEKTPTIISTSPTNNEEEVLENKQIEIFFNLDISENQKSKITIFPTPDFIYDLNWANSTYQILPKSNLENNKKYLVKINYKNKEIGNFSFTTAIFSQKQIQTDGIEQSKDDYLYGRAILNLTKEYPFYTSLPIKTKNYIIDFNFDEKKFAITFIVDVGNPETKTSLTLEALDKIRKIGVKDPIQFYTRP